MAHIPQMLQAIFRFQDHLNNPAQLQNENEEMPDPYINNEDNPVGFEEEEDGDEGLFYSIHVTS